MDNWLLIVREQRENGDAMSTLTLTCKDSNKLQVKK